MRLLGIFGVSILTTVAAMAAQSSNDVWSSRTVKYDTRDIVSIGTKIRYTTLVVLPQNEKIVDFVVGDKDFWVVEGAQNFAYIKPSKAGASTNVTLITSTGSVYSLVVTELSSQPGQPVKNPDLKVFLEPLDPSRTSNTTRFVAAEDVLHLEDALARMTEQTEKDRAAFRADYPQQLQFEYKFDHERKPFNVSAIYNDGKFTYIRSSAAEKPTLYEWKDGKANLVNFSMENGLYVVDKVVEEGWLSIGTKRLAFRRVK